MSPNEQDEQPTLKYERVREELTLDYGEVREEVDEPDKETIEKVLDLFEDDNDDDDSSTGVVSKIGSLILFTLKAVAIISPNLPFTQ